MLAASRLTTEQRKKCEGCSERLVATILGYYCVKCKRNYPFGTV
jgi:hypothetical protein